MTHEARINRECPDVGTRVQPKPRIHDHLHSVLGTELPGTYVSSRTTIEPNAVTISDSDLGIDIAVMRAEAQMIGGESQLPAAIAAIRAKRIAELHELHDAEQRVLQAHNVTTNVRPDRPPYFVR